MNCYLNTQEKETCCGCGACLNICNRHAIHMEPDEEGFLYPVIDKSKCINCGLCEKVCPISGEKDYNVLKQTAFYAWATDNDKRIKSSSGGIFALLAEQTLSTGGHVFGCTYDENFKAVHIEICSASLLYKLKGSKYVQSDLNNTFLRIKTLLQNKNDVLFAGTPCQVDALKCFLQKDYSTLRTIDLICHGVPSPKLFDDYLTMLCKDKKENLVFFNLRGKNKFSAPLGVEYRLRKKNKIINHFLSTNTCSYYYAFLHNLLHRPACYSCKYANLSRTGDITLGDFWGIEKYYKGLDMSKGISLVLTNNEHGEKMFNSVKAKAEIHPVDIKIAVANNGNLSAPSPRPPERDNIYTKIFSMDFKRANKKFLRRKNYLFFYFVSKVPLKIKKKLYNFLGE